MNKKTLIIIAAVFGVIAVSFGVYFAIKKTKEIITPPESSVPSGYFGRGVSEIPVSGISAEKKKSFRLSATKQLLIIGQPAIFE